MFSYKLSIFNNSLARSIKNIHLKNIFGKIPHGENILDYGSGYTPYKQLAESRFKYFFTAEFPLTSGKIYKNDSDFIINEDETTNCNRNFFDCVLITEVLEHIFKPIDALTEVYRILKPGGLIIGSVPFTMNEHDQPYDYFRYTYYSLEKMLDESGFENINIIYAGDSLGSFIHLFSRNLNIIIKILDKLRLQFLSVFISLFIIKIPEYIYYILYISGFRPGKLDYFRIHPLGFIFTASKK